MVWIKNAQVDIRLTSFTNLPNHHHSSFSIYNRIVDVLESHYKSAMKQISNSTKRLPHNTKTQLQKLHKGEIPVYHSSLNIEREKINIIKNSIQTQMNIT
jgi:hypothetical protein